MKSKVTLRSLFEKKFVLLIISFVLALSAWIMVAYLISPETTKVIRNVPVRTNERDAAYKTFGLHIVSETSQTVDVVVTGARTTVNGLTADNIRVTPVFSSVEFPGTFTLALAASRNNTTQSFNIQPIKDTIVLTFDAEAQKRFTVDTTVSGVSADDGLMFGNSGVTPLEIVISGPEADINRIATVSAEYNGQDEVLNQSLEVIVDIKLYDAAGREISAENLSLSDQEATITIPVLQRGILPLALDFVNVPKGFDISTLNYVLSHTEIAVAADPAVIETLDTKIVGEVDLARFEIGEEYKFEVILPSNIKNLEGIDTVVVTFPKENLDSRKVRVTEFRVDNAPTNYDIEILTEFINNVTVLGPTEELELLMDSSVVAVVDLSLIPTIERGERDITARFRVAGSSTLWVAGIYNVVVLITPN
ncbi:MAG: hypothetical protein FWG21_00960 [Oscillospiraceae bacterium]|nr:hypothetical protein [Oscillospiraceae bacterium]